MNKSVPLAFILSIVLSASSFSQVAKEEKYQVQQYTTENGLPSNGIKGIEWDEQSGFLWIATEAGISRYNGVEFRNFTKENTKGLLHERMAYAVKDRNGTIYLADVGRNQLIIHLAIPVFEPFPQLREINGFKSRFYLGTTGAKLREKVLRLLNQTGDTNWPFHLQITDTSLFVGLASKKFYYISESRIDSLKLASKYSGLFLIESKLFAVDSTRKLSRVSEDLSEYSPIKMLTPFGEEVLINPGNTFLHFTPGMKNPILFSDNNAWLLFDKGNFVEARLICSAVPSYSFIRYAQYSEKNKTLFIGTDSKGIIVIRENRVSSHKKLDTDIRELNAYYSQVELPNGNVLTGEGHVIGSQSGDPGPLPIRGKFSFSVHTMDDSLIWYAQDNEQYKKMLLHRYSYRSGLTEIFPKIFPITGTFAITRVNEQLWLGTEKGVGLIRGDSVEFIFKPGRGKTSQAPPYTMIEFSPGKLGVASCEGLIVHDLNKLTSDTIFRPFGYCIRSLWKYKDYIFIGTYGQGFYLWKNGQLKPMPLDKNKFLLYTHCVVPDQEGYCWISSNRGLFKAQLSDIIDAYENNRTQIYYHYFGKNDGMDITEMNGGCTPCALVLKNQTLSFPTMDGLLWVDPKIAKPLLPEGNIYIDEFIAGDKNRNPDSLALKTLPFNARDIVIKLGFSAWCNKENIYLEYKLNPKSKWVPVDINNGAFIRLNNLRPGTYKLQVRKLNGFGIDNYSYKEIGFSIRTPWQQQWWFYALCILSLLGLITIYLRFRTRLYKSRQRKLEQQVAEKTRELQEQNELLEKNNTIKTRLISIISHDIVTPLKFVTVAGKNLMEKRKMMTEDMQQETINEITNTSQELQLLSTNILNWIKYQNENRRMAKENFDLHEMVNQVLGILQTLARQKNISIINQIQPAMEIHQYYEPLKILVYNLLTNAIQFTEKGVISVTAAKENGSLTVNVTDDGIGMTPEQVQRLMAEDVVITSANVDNKRGHGLGYLIIKDLVKTMGAILRIESKKDHGTTVSVRMPAIKTEEA